MQHIASASGCLLSGTPCKHHQTRQQNLSACQCITGALQQLVHTSTQEYSLLLQQVAAPTSSEQQQQLITREAALQEAQAALQTQQQQLADNQKELQQQQQSLATTQQQFVEQQQRLTASEQQLQQQQAACREKAQELAEHKAQLQAQEGASVQAGQQQQEVSDAKVCLSQLPASSMWCTFWSLFLHGIVAPHRSISGLSSCQRLYCYVLIVILQRLDASTCVTGPAVARAGD